MQPVTKQKIAVIEDDLPICTMYELKLKNDGYIVKTAYNGEQGLELCQEFQPALILLDLRMPIMTGDEMLARLRAEEWGSMIRVIILTNVSKNEAPQSLRFLRVDRYVVKAHHTPKQIVEIIDEVLRS